MDKEVIHRAAYGLMQGGTYTMPAATLAEIKAMLPPGAELEVVHPVDEIPAMCQVTATVRVPMDPPAATTARTIDYGRYVLQRDWPVDAHVQGGSSGLVFARESTYRTAFVEVVLNNPRTFIRGEGDSMESAEQEAWSQYERVTRNDHEHEFETRGYRNGAGICKVCDLFQSNVFTPSEVGSRCSVCGTPTFHSRVGQKLFCEAHTPTREERQRLRAEATARGEHVNMLESIFDSISMDDD